jgi:branched-subunit amino acid aminotransferase/4-amino-4-deoxychorismate lyase
MRNFFVKLNKKKKQTKKKNNKQQKQLFEGLKAYKDAQGRIRLFRPDKNVERINNSAQRLVFPVRNFIIYLVVCSLYSTQQQNKQTKQTTTTHTNNNERKINK